MLEGGYRSFTYLRVNQVLEVPYEVVRLAGLAVEAGPLRGATHNTNDTTWHDINICDTHGRQRVNCMCKQRKELSGWGELKCQAVACMRTMCGLCGTPPGRM